MAGYAGRASVIQLGNGTTAAATNITNVVVASGIATITSSTHGLADNDVVYIANAGGITGINDDYHLVRKVDADNVTLDGSPGVSGTYTSGGTIQIQNTAYTSIANLLTFEDGEADDEIDVSAVDTPQGFREFVAGMIGADFAFTGNWAPNEATHGMIIGLYAIKRAATAVWWRQLFPQVSTTQYPAKAFLGLLLNLRESIDAEGKLGLSGSGRITRARLMMPGQ